MSVRIVLLVTILAVLCSPVCAAKVGFDWWGNMTVDGQPFFPRELYNTCSEEILPVCKEAGFNTTFVGNKEGFDLAAKYGFMAIQGGFYGRDNEINIDRVIQSILTARQHPAMLGYYMVDEPDLKPHLASFETLAAVASLVKSMDKEHPTTVTCAGKAGETTHDFGGYAELVDMFRIDPYPVQALRPMNISKLVQWEFLKTTAGAQPYVLIMQGWHRLPPQHRLPTPEQDRIETYAGLAMGAKGVSHYAYRFYDTGKPIVLKEEAPELWEAWAECNREIIQLQPVLFAPYPTDTIMWTDADSEDVVTMIKEVDDKVYIIAANIGDKPSKVRLAFSREIGTEAKILFRDLPPAQIHGRWLDYELPALEERVFEIADTRKPAPARVDPSVSSKNPEIDIRLTELRVRNDKANEVFISNNTDRVFENCSLVYKLSEWDGKKAGLVLEQGSIPVSLGPNGSVRRVVNYGFTIPGVDFSAQNRDLSLTLEHPSLGVLASTRISCLNKPAEKLPVRREVVAGRGERQMRCYTADAEAVRGSNVIVDTSLGTLPDQWPERALCDNPDIKITHLGKGVYRCDVPLDLEASDIRVLFAGSVKGGQTARAILELPVAAPLDVSSDAKERIREDGSASFKLTIDNRYKEDLEIKPVIKPSRSSLNASCAADVIKLPAKGSAEYDITINAADLPPGRWIMNVNMVSRGDVLGSVPVGVVVEPSFPRAPDKITIDGDLSDWARVAALPISDDSDSIQEFVKPNPDMEAKARVTWDDDYFYFSCDVTDIYHRNRMRGIDYWREDCVQLALDTSANGSWNSDDDDCQLCFVLDDGGSPVVYRYWDGDRMETGEITSVDFQVVDNDGHTYYEAAIPWSDLFALKPQPGSRFGLSVQVNDRNQVNLLTAGWGGGVQEIDRRRPRSTLFIKGTLVD